MKRGKYSRSVYVYQLKYLNEWNLNKSTIYKLHKVFAGLTDFPKVIGESHELCKAVCSFYEFDKSCLRVPWTS